MILLFQIFGAFGAEKMILANHDFTENKFRPFGAEKMILANHDFSVQRLLQYEIDSDYSYTAPERRQTQLEAQRRGRDGCLPKAGGGGTGCRLRGGGKDGV